MATQYVTCPNCNSQNTNFSTACANCGMMLPAGPMQPAGGYGNQGAQIPGADKKVLAGILGIVLGGLGIHKFVLGYTTEGVIMLVTYLAGLFLCGIPSLAIHVIGLVEGIMYLMKSDAEFVDTYINHKKGWF